MVEICQTGLLKLNFETRPKKRIFRFLPKISAGHGWSWNFFLPIFKSLGPQGIRDGLLYLKMWKKSKSLHPNIHVLSSFPSFLGRLLVYIDKFINKHYITGSSTLSSPHIPFLFFYLQKHNLFLLVYIPILWQLSFFNALFLWFSWHLPFL